MQDRINPPSISAPPAWYTGAQGQAYFRWQNRTAECTAQIEARKFQKYINPTDAVLDFGCGGGHTLRRLKCLRRVGVDVNPAAIAVASQAGIECYDSISAIPDETFNVVISNHALEHVEHPIAVLRAFRDKLLPSGVLVVCLPIDDWRKQRVYNSQDVNHHLHTWTPQLLGNSLFEAGFQPNQFSIQILPHALFPGTAETYGRIPEPVFDKLCQAFARFSKRRQIIALATKG